MIYLHTLGDSLIKVGEKDIRPTSPLVFAALLYLGMERGHRVSRTALRELLFSKSDERSGAHSLRQLLYKLRYLGAPLEADAGSVTIRAASVEGPWSHLEHGSISSDDLHCLSLGMLPGYEPTLSDGFRLWLEDLRSSAAARIRAALLADLARGRSAGDLAAVQRTSSALLKMDPLNEEATLAQAEALALAGQKRQAVRLLETYAGEVGGASPELRIAPNVLRRRIVERLDAVERSKVPLIGREAELSWLLAQFARVVESAPTVTMLWGEAGIGKSRLVREFAAHVLLRRARMETTHCQPHDVDRPLGALIDVVPKLLRARGALGVGPDKLATLQRLVGTRPTIAGTTAPDPEHLTAQICDALAELLASVASEGPLLLIVEDAHWLDQASFRLLLRTIPAHSGRLHLVLTSRERPAFSSDVLPSESVFVRQLEPLGSAAASMLLARALGEEPAVSDSTREECVALAAGNPLFLCTIAEHIRLRGVAPSARSGVFDLLKQRVRMLDARSLLLLRFVAALGNHGTQDRLAACVRMADDAYLLALQDLADRGLLVHQDGVTKCAHDLLAEVVLSDAPSLMRVAVFSRVASVLEDDGNTTKQVGMLWSCAESWRLAEDRASALRVLRHCAAFAEEIGQPSFACSSLEKAQELCDETERLGLIQDTIRVAELAQAHDALVQNIDRYKAVLSVRGEKPTSHHRYELLRIHAARARGESIWHLRDKLVRYALDRSATTSNRIMAARQFLLAATQQLAKTEAARLYSALDDFVFASAASFEARELRLLFNMLFGDLQLARAEAVELFAVVDTRDGALCAPLGNIAIALFYAGASESAFQVSQVAVDIGERLGLHNLVVQHLGQRASFHSYLGDIDNATRWHERAEEHLKLCDHRYAALQLTNRIDSAMRLGDLESARRELGTLKSYREAQTPHGIRTVRGFEILIAHLEGSLHPDAIDLVDLERIDQMGRDAVEHHIFALAQYLAISAKDRAAEAAERLRDYVFVHRRERYSLVPYYRVTLGNSAISGKLEGDLANTA